MDGEAYFRTCCTELGLDCKALFQIGAQKAKSNTRFNYKCSRTSRKDTQQFAVCYFYEEDVFVSWDLNSPKARTFSCFSVNKDEIVDIQFDHLLYVKKSREYSGWGEETVCAFRPNAVKEFLQTKVVNNL